MISTMPAGQHHLHALRRFVRTPKGLLLVVLVLLVLFAAPAAGVGRVLPGVVSATAAAVLVDVAIVRLTRRVWFVPSGALLTGLIVAMVLSPDEPWYVPIVISALAIGSKYCLRTRLANVFNPAALALVLAVPLFSSGQSWWGALPDLPPLALVVLLGTGIALVHHLNKLPLALVFLGSYFALFTLASFLDSPVQVAEAFRSPDLNAVLFFALFMLDDPPTSPVRYSHQVAFGLIVAGVSVAIFLTLGGVYYLLAGLLVANRWEAWRRKFAHASPIPPHPPAFRDRASSPLTRS